MSMPKFSTRNAMQLRIVDRIMIEWPYLVALETVPRTPIRWGGECYAVSSPFRVLRRYPLSRLMFNGNSCQVRAVKKGSGFVAANFQAGGFGQLCNQGDRN